MLRHPIAMLLARAAILAGSVALGAHMFIHTVGDPERPGRVMQAVLDSPDGQATIADTVSAAVVTAHPGTDQAATRAAVATALADPRVRDGMAEAVSVRDGTLVSGGHVSALLAAAVPDPALAAKVAATPVPPLGVPAAATSRLAVVNDRLEKIRDGALTAAWLLAGAAFLLSPRRPVVLRRFARAAGVASVGLVAVFVVAPELLQDSQTGWARTLGVALDAGGAALIEPVLLVAGFAVVCGVLAFASSWVCPVAARREVPRSSRALIRRRRAQLSAERAEVRAAERTARAQQGRPVDEAMDPHVFTARYPG